MFWKKFTLLALSPIALFATVDIDAPWFTGPLICPSPHVVPQGHFNLEPYIFYNNIVGSYDNSWKYHAADNIVSNLNFQAVTQIGLLPRMDLTIVPQFYYNLNYDPKNPWAFGDLSMKIGIQLISGSHLGGIPSVKITLGENFPLGKYQFLDDDMGGTDAYGGGSYGTTLGLVAGRLFHFSGAHYLATRGALEATVFSGVNLRGKNAYGGDATTNGKFHPGGLFNLILGGEFSITKHLVLALDVVNVYSLKSTFHGTTIEPVGNTKESYQLSFAPALEWNFTANVGIIGGVWLTAIGANSSAFING
ncbi:MAG: hypothetical protein FJZ56_04730, partial [Chlamydiae bacterium]|nr:hypothetical protein [Chlamydiota bacterium]